MKSWILCSALAVVYSLCLSGCSSSKEELHLYSWADYVKPELIERFEEKYNCKVVVDTYDSNESMYAKLKAGATGYDVMLPTGYFVGLLEKQDLLQPIDPAKVPNMQFLDRDHPIFRDNQEWSHSLPYMIGYTGIAYRKDKIKDPQQSWNIFSHKEYSGRMTMVSDIRDAIGAALKYLGYSYNTEKKEEIEAAASQIIEWKKNLAKFENEQYKNGIASGEYLVCQGYSGDIIQVMRENDKVSFFLPKEGTHVSCDYFVIPKSAKKSDLAHEFINFLLDPEIATENMLFLCYISPNKGVYKQLPADILANPAFFPSRDILEKSETVVDIGDSIVNYNKAWDRIKETN